jgi:DNA-binding beta-propeller fold protein YncE
MPARPLRLIVAIVALAALSGAGWLLVSRVLDRPKPTPFGWAAALTTIAGDGARGFADGTGAKARFSDPFAVAVGPDGELYVADAGETNRIRRIGSDGRTTTLPGAFDTPSGLAVDRAGNLYVADTGANLIRKIGRDGRLSTLAGDGVAGFRDGPAGQAQFNGPVGVAVDAGGNVYVADTYNDRIRLITPEGQVRTLAGGAGPGFADGTGAGAAFDTPCGLALDPATGALLIADTGNDAIRRLGRGGAVTTLARGAPEDRTAVLRGPIGLAATPDGYLYIATFRRGRILEMSPRGELRVLTGRDAWAPQNRGLRLARPAGLAIDRHGDLYVAEAALYAIRKLSLRRPGDTAAAPAPGLAPAQPALMRAAAVPWPLAPQWGAHEVVGDMGEVRGDYHGEGRDHLHAGLDVRADVGATVLAAADEKVESPLPDWDVDGLSEGLQVDQLTYIHMRVGRLPTGAPLDPGRFQLVRDAAGKLAAVRVKRGTRFRVGDPLGTVNRMAHVHLELGARGGDFNPMALRFPGLADHFAPRISAIQLIDATGRQLDERAAGRLVVRRDAGPLSIVADAWDQVDGDAARRRLGIYQAGYQILAADGAPVRGFEQPQINLVFDRLPLDREATKLAYAPLSGDTAHSAQQTSFLYVVTNRVRGGQAETGGWRPSDLPPGDYTVRIFAADYAGNIAVEGRDLPITVR